MKYSSALETSEHVTAKVRALRAVPEIAIAEDVESVRATLPDGRMVFSALQKHAGGPWITRQARGMFDRVMDL